MRNNNYLIHYGTKGQKWGVRNYQNEDGSYTSKGQSENSGHGRYYSGENTDAKSIEYNSKKKQLEKQRNIAIGLATTTAILAGGYLTYKYIKNNKDIIVKGGEYIQRISANKESVLNDSFYASFGKHDNKRYSGLMQMHLHGKNLDDKMYTNKLLLTKDIRAINDNKARKIFNDMLKDDKFREAVNEVANKYTPGYSNSDSARKFLLAMLGRGKQYEGFNRMFGDYNNRNSKAAQMFFDKLKDLGYNALSDVNDKKYSGYMAKSPLIIFDDTVATIADTSVKDISKFYKDKSYLFEYGKAITERYIKLAGGVAVTTLGVSKAREAITTQKEINELDEVENNEKHN